MKKQIIISICALVFMASIFSSCDHFCDSSQEVEEISLSWRGDSLGSLFLEKYHLIMPFTINEVNDTFKLKLNLDFEGSFLYEETVMEKLNVNPDVCIITDTIANVLFLTGLSGKTGNYSFDDRSIILKRYFSNDFSEIIGNIDLEFFRDKILCINFPEESILVYKKRDKIDKIDKIVFKPFAIQSGKIHITININNKDYNFRLTGESIVYALFNTEAIEGKELITKINGQTTDNPALFPTPQDIINEEIFDGIIGTSYLGNKILILDLSCNEFAILTNK